VLDRFCAVIPWRLNQVGRGFVALPLIALVKLLLRLRSQVQIRVRAAGKQTNERTEEQAFQRKPRFNKPYELTSLLTILARHT
jgi:hypothetical protein